jgi:hypothetical protein
LLQLADMSWAGLASQFPAQGGSRSRPTVPKFSRQTRADLSGHQVKRKSWNPCGLAAILWRSDRFAILVFFASILVGAADVEGGALSWAAAWRAGGCCGMSGTDVGTAAACTRVSMSTRGGPTLSERIRMIGLATSLWSVVSGSGKWDDTTNRSARSAPPTKVK